MDNIDILVSRVKSAAQKLDDACSYSERKCFDYENNATALYNASGEILPQINSNLITAHSELTIYRNAMSKAKNQAEIIGVQLLKHFSEANQIVDQINAEKKAGDRIKLLLDSTWEDTQKIIHRYNTMYNTWSIDSQSISKQKKKLDAVIHSMEIQFDSMKAAQETMYRIMQEFIKERFDLACQAYNDIGLEALFYRQDEQFARLKLHNQKNKQQLNEFMLGIDIRNLTEEKPSKWKEKIRKIMLERVEKTDSTPKRHQVQHKTTPRQRERGER